jgi:drug/metabolite transporter (DMT)-like permease
MLGGNLKSYLHLHLIVFIWGFTAILGDLISINDISLVWYRMLLAGICLLLLIKVKGLTLKLPAKEVLKLALVGGIIAAHWIFFFKAIKISNVSVTLAMFSCGAFFASVLEPLLYKRKMLGYEVFFGLIIIAGLFYMMQVELTYFWGAISALFSVFLGVIFTLFNGIFTHKHHPIVITVYEFFAGFLFVTAYLAFNKSFTPQFFQLSATDWFWLAVLSSVCTAYAFTAAVSVMQKLSPYTVMLTTNLEPVYGILMAFFILGDSERMSWSFYLVAAVILAVVILNGIIKNYKNRP